MAIEGCGNGYSSSALLAMACSSSCVYHALSTPLMSLTPVTCGSLCLCLLTALSQPVCCAGGGWELQQRPLCGWPEGAGWGMGGAGPRPGRPRRCHHSCGLCGRGAGRARWVALPTGACEPVRMDTWGKCSFCFVSGRDGLNLGVQSIVTLMPLRKSTPVLMRTYRWPRLWYLTCRRMFSLLHPSSP